MIPSKQICYCGNPLPYHQCCQPLIDGNQPAATPEQLMRSRFSAYAAQKYQYIYLTYATESQKTLSIANIKESAEGCHWLALVIHSEDESTPALTNTAEQFVEFSAFYITDDGLYEMREKSRFVLVMTNSNSANNHNYWRYIDGEILAHNQLTQLSRNQLCPCNNYPTTWVKNKGKKYKHCCGK